MIKKFALAVCLTFLASSGSESAALSNEPSIRGDFSERFQLAQDVQRPPRRPRPAARPGVRPPGASQGVRPNRPAIQRPAGQHRPVLRPGQRPGISDGYRPSRPAYRPSYRPGYRPGTSAINRPALRPNYRPGWRPPPGYTGWQSGWRPRPYYGRYWSPGAGWAIAAVGLVALGVLTNIEAEEYAVPPAPGDDYCWFYTDTKRTSGYWAKCPPLADALPNTPLVPFVP